MFFVMWLNIFHDHTRMLALFVFVFVIFLVGAIYDGEFHHECVSQDGRAAANSKSHAESLYRRACRLLFRTFSNWRNGTRCDAQVKWQSNTWLKSCKHRTVNLENMIYIFCYVLCIQSFSQHDFISQPVRFRLNHASTTGKPAAEREFSIWVGDLSTDVDDYSLYRAFAAKYNSIRTAKVILDSSGFSKGYGFVRFANEEEQKNSLITMNGYRGLGTKSLKICNAVPRPWNKIPGYILWL